MYSDIEISPPFSESAELKINRRSVIIPAGTSRVKAWEFVITEDREKKSVGLYFRGAADNGLGSVYVTRDEFETFREQIGKYGK